MTNSSNRRKPKVWIALLILLLVAGAIAADWYSALPESAQATYVGRESCAQCHSVQLDQWHGSDHDRAMEIADDASVLGDFNNTTFTRFDVTTRFFRRDGKYFANTEGPDGKLQDFEIKYTFGIRPLQQYMVEFPDGRVQVLRVSWDTEKNEWFYVTPADVTDERILPGDPLHWTGIGQNWNTMCAACHSTNLQKNFDLATNTYNTTFSEIDVSCESCHGPASLHVELAQSNSLFWDRIHGYGLPKLKGTHNSVQVETCAPCHSRRSQIHPNFHAGKKFLDHYDPALLNEGLYHADGQILDEVYVYGSFLQSKMYAKGVRCTDCHNPHSLELKFEGNRLCAQCHQPGKYDSPTHHHHTDPAGSQCVNCHMPSKDYMVIDGRRDHSLRVPRPDLTVQIGTPNACNDCHTRPEESAEWAAKAVVEWYGEKRADDPHYGVAFAAARRGEAEGFDLLKELLKKRDTPDIVRATAVSLFNRYPGRESEKLIRREIDDSNSWIRVAALRALSGLSQGLSQPEFFQQVAKKLRDPILLVRLAAVRTLAVASQLLDGPDRESFKQALTEYHDAQMVMRERAGAYLNLAALSQSQGDAKATLSALQTALKLGPYLSGVRDKLANQLEQQGGDPDTIKKLREDEVDLLERDSKLLPDSAGPRYQRGMLLYLLQRYDEARQSLEEACELAPENYNNWLALALLCEKQQRWDRAVEALKRMSQLRPEDPATRGIFLRIKQSMENQEQLE